MKLMRNNNEAAPGGRVLRAVVLLMVGVGLHAAAQETNLLSRTNLPAGTNLSTQTNSLAPTNDLTRTNELAPTNSLLQTNAPAETNPPAPPNEVPPPSTFPAASPAPAGSTRLDYPSFTIIAERNIFNPNRTSRTRYVPQEYRRPVRTESFALVGTMSYEKGFFAFFDGSSDDFRKTLKPGEEIARFKLSEIAHNHVKLAAQSNEIQLVMGSQMRRVDDGEWTLVAEAYSGSAPAIVSTVTTSPSPATNAGVSTVVGGAESPATVPAAVSATAPGTSSGSSESDVLKKLMQRREQEMNK